MKRDPRARGCGSITDGPGRRRRGIRPKQGGILRMYSPDSPASMSIHEEATIFAEGPMMGVFNNLVMYDQYVPQNSLQSIVPDLAIGWSWNEDGTELTSRCEKASRGMMASPSRPRMSSARGTC